MPYKALTEDEKDKIIKEISLMGTIDGAIIIKIITELALKFDASVKVMIDLCFVNIILAVKDDSNALKIGTLFSKSFYTQGMKTRHIALTINGNPTRVLIQSESETIVKLGDVKEASMAVLNAHEDYHNSDLKDYAKKSKKDEPSN